MAILLETLRSAILDSIKGRKFGLDPYGNLVGMPAVREQVEDLTTTAATSASPYGVTNVLTSGSSQNGQYTLQAPVGGGVRKTVRLQSTSTGTQQFQLSGGAVVIGGSLTTVGSTVFSLLKQNASISLVSLSSALWAMTNVATSLVSSDSQGLAFSTST